MASVSVDTPVAVSFPSGEVVLSDPLPDDLSCQICLGVAMNPTVTEHCGHLFCNSCIMTALNLRAECPVDRRPLEINQLRKDIRASRRIGSLACRCQQAATALHTRPAPLPAPAGGPGSAVPTPVEKTSGPAAVPCNVEQRSANVEGKPSPPLVAAHKVRSSSAASASQRAGKGPSVDAPRCTWHGVLSDAESHLKGCSFSPTKCQYADIGCAFVAPRVCMAAHMETDKHHHLQLATVALTAARTESADLKRSVAMHQAALSRDSKYVWIIPQFCGKSFPICSECFTLRGCLWYLVAESDLTTEMVAVYLFAYNHEHRVPFRITIYNENPNNDFRHDVNDWAPDFKGKGWGPRQLLQMSTMHKGFIFADGSAMVGIELRGAPY